MARGRDSKERIARTALGLFVEKGLAETSIRDIAAGAGFASEATIYRHFESKEALAWELFSTNLAAFAEELDKLRRAQTGLKARIEAMIRYSCAFFDKDPVLFSYLLLTQHAQHRKVTDDMPIPFRVIVKTIAQGMEKGEIPERDPVLAASMVFGLMRQVAISKLNRELKGSLSSHADALVAASWRVLKG